MQPPRGSSGERGSTLIVALVLIATCAAIVASSTLTHASAQRGAKSSLARERAFQAADAGIDWGVSKLRALRGSLPLSPTETLAVDPSASFSVRYVAGDADGIDDDDDGLTDEADESDFTVVVSTGSSARARYTLRAVISRRDEFPVLSSAAAIESETPILTLNGNAFDITGEDHSITGTKLGAAPEVYGITSQADPATLASQIAAGNADQVDGLGTGASVGASPFIDLEALYAKYAYSATVVLEPGTHTHGDYGTASLTGMQVVACDGDLHLSANTGGAGVLLVHGDLTVTGSFTWTGIIIATGRISLNGTGNEKIVGTILAGEELDISGNVTAKFSTPANSLAAQSLQPCVIAAWIDPARR